MVSWRKLKRTLAAGLDSLGVRRQGEKRLPGLPDGVTFDELRELCLAHWGKRLQAVSYLHLSSWKPTGTYRLFLQTVRARQRRLIYKNAVCGADHLPGLVGLPIHVGPPEYLIYNNSKAPLAAYLPTVYVSREVLPGTHYQYLLEDVSEDWQEVCTPEAVLCAAGQLPMVHRALSEWLSSVDPSRLVCYDTKYQTAFLNYVGENIHCYAQQNGDETIAQLCKYWRQVSALYGSKGFQEMELPRPIHGDLAPAHILMHRTRPNAIKLVDWEWAGLGFPHQDLAVLLKRFTPEAEEQALLHFARQHTHLSLEEHRRLYQWCKLGSGLLDAAWGIAQQVGSASGTSVNVHRGIVAGARLALDAYRALQQKDSVVSLSVGVGAAEALKSK